MAENTFQMDRDYDIHRERVGELKKFVGDAFMDSRGRTPVVTAGGDGSYTRLGVKRADEEARNASKCLYHEIIPGIIADLDAKYGTESMRPVGDSTIRVFISDDIFDITFEDRRRPKWKQTMMECIFEAVYSQTE